MHKLLRSVVVSMIAILMSLSSTLIEEPIPEPVVLVAQPIIVLEETKQVCVTENAVPIEAVTQVIEEEALYSDEEIELLALVTMAEAEGESEEGKRLVIDTILNRVDSELSYFPDTIHDVIYQKNAFSSMWNGRVDKCYVDEDICQLVREELESRTNTDVLYFHANRYGAYGTPIFSVGNHYFSG